MTSTKKSLGSLSKLLFYLSVETDALFAVFGLNDSFVLIDIF